MKMISPPFICEKENNGNVQNTSMPGKILIDTFSLEDFIKLKINYGSEKRITKYMESPAKQRIDESERLKQELSYALLSIECLK